jgi:putative ABC transport system permease protein
MNPWPFVLADLRAGRAGVIAVVLLIAVAIALGVAVSAQERALRRGSAQAADAFDLLIGAPGSETQLVLSTVYLQPAPLTLIDGRHLARLAADATVAFAAPLGFGDRFQGHPVIGTSAALVEHLGGGSLAAGRMFARIDEVVVGHGVDLPLDASFEPVHGEVEHEDAETHAGFRYRVVGRLPRLGTPWDQAILAPIEAVWWIHGLPVGHALDPAAVWPAGPAGPPALAAVPVGPPWTAAELPGLSALVVKPTSFATAYQLRARFRAGADTMAVFPAEVLVQLYGLLGDVRDLLAILAVVTQVLVIGAVLLAVLTTLALRRKVLAVLRALGASRAFVFATIWTSVALLLVAGALLGLALGMAGAAAISAVFAARTGLALPAGIGWPELRLVGAIIVIGLALAALPAAHAYRSPVAASLRS